MAFGLAETSKLIVDLSLQGNFLSQLGKVNGALSKTAANLDRTQSRAYRAGQQIGIGIKRGAVIAAAGIGFIASQVAFGVKSLINLEQVTTQTAAVLRSTKGAAGQTAEGIRSLSESFESLNAQMDDTVIQSGANVLLTFTNIRQKAFKPALQAALDLSTAMHQDLQTSVVQLGKALNDPAKGLTSLQRIGVSFSAVQKKQIDSYFQLSKSEQKQYANLLKSNKAKAAAFLADKRQNAITKAQGVILAEINKEFGGSFAAGGKTIAGQFASIGDAVEDLQRVLATALLPTISKVALAIESFLRDPATVKGISDFGQTLADAFTSDQIINGIKSLTDNFGTLVDLVKVAAAPVRAIVGAFLSLPRELQTVLIGAFAVNKLTGGLVTNIAGGLVESFGKSLFGMRGGTPANPLFVSDVSGGIGKGAGIGGGSILGLIGPAAIAAVISKTVTDMTNSQFAGLGIQTNFAAPGSGGDNPLLAALPFGIGSAIQNLSEGFRLLAGGARKANSALTDLEKPTPAFKPSERHFDVTNRKTAASFIERTRGSRGDALFKAETKVKTKSGGEVSSQRDIESLRGKIAEGLRTTGKQIDDIARKVNPKLTDLERRVDSSGSLVAGAIAANRASINQSINIKVDVTASGIHKTVTIQNRYGRATGSAHTDRNGNLGFGGAR